MDIFWQVFYTLLVLSALIFFHEFGHFIAAKACGVRVTEFALGMGPAIFKKQGKETLYALRLFPIGGYCAMTGEDEEVEGDPRAMRNKPVWQRMIIVVAGAAMNLLIGVILITVIVCAKPIPSTVVADFPEGAISNTTGLQAEDQILSVNGTEISGYADLSTVFSAAYNTDTFAITVLRDGQEVLLPNVTFPHAEVDKELYMPQVDFRVYRAEKTFGVVVENIFEETGAYLTMMFTTLGDMVTGRISLKYVSGPIGISSAIADAAALGWASLFSIAALISINLCVMNLLPLPALDGGRFLCMLIEAIIRRPIPAKVEGIIHTVGLIVLLALMAIIAFKDIFFPV